jgi:hypothetical protein
MDTTRRLEQAESQEQTESLMTAELLQLVEPLERLALPRSRTQLAAARLLRAWSARERQKNKKA